MLEPTLKIEISQKKIRTENLLAWEHEKFHLKKINAITLSSAEVRIVIIYHKQMQLRPSRAEFNTFFSKYFSESGTGEVEYAGCER